jgi:hypothetical protein
MAGLKPRPPKAGEGKGAGKMPALRNAPSDKVRRSGRTSLPGRQGSVLFLLVDRGFSRDITIDARSAFLCAASFAASIAFGFSFPALFFLPRVRLEYDP